MKKDIKLVYIYLGDEIPKYAIDNVNRTSNLFGKETYLFISKGKQIDIANKIDHKVKIESIDRINEVEKFKLQHEFTFRDGFWFYTFERLLALKHIHEIVGENNPILHIEADMLLLPSFPFDKYLMNKLRWFSHDGENDVASLVYSPSIEETNWLYQELLKLANSDPYLTDMSALFRIRNRNPFRIETFPDLFSYSTSKDPVDLFDGLTLGQWLTGMDPRNTYGFTFLHENNEFVSYAGSRLRDVLDSSSFNLNSRGQIEIVTREFMGNLHCLHVHSKKLDLFDASNQPSINRYLNFTKDLETLVIDFDFKLLVRLIKQNCTKGKVMAYLRNFIKFLLKKDEKCDFRFLAVLRYMFIFKKQGVY